MSELNQKRITFSGGPQGTASSAKILKDGRLVVELFDFSDVTKDHFGDAVAFLLFVSASEKHQVLRELLKTQTNPDDIPDRDALLLRLMQEQFDDYHAVKQWLDERGIAYKKAIYYET